MTGFWALIYINRTVQPKKWAHWTAKDDISSQLATAYITNDHKQQSGACNVDGDETVLETVNDGMNGKGKPPVSI